MSLRKALLGKIFISHSWADKTFVRKLSRRLWREDYQVWLDEKELVPGDRLSERLSDALRDSKIVIVVVSPHSIKSKWLRFELYHAANRMVEEDCRIIPALLGEVALPTQLEGLVYADFRRSFASGMNSILAALSKESEERARRSWMALDALIEDVFDGSGSASLDGEYESYSYSFVTVDRIMDGDDEAAIAYDVIHDYLHQLEPLTRSWFKEFEDVAQRFGPANRLVVTQRPIDFYIDRKSQASRVGARIRRSSARGQAYLVVVFADISGLDGDEDQKAVLKEAKELFKGIYSVRDLP